MSFWEKKTGRDSASTGVAGKSKAEFFEIDAIVANDDNLARCLSEENCQARPMC